MDSESLEGSEIMAALQTAAGQSALPDDALPIPESYGNLLQGEQEPIPSKAASCIVRNKFASDPSRREYGSLAEAFDHFNEMLFSGRLPPALLTLNHSRASIGGYYHPDRFSFRGEDSGQATRLSEISLNPQAMEGRTDTEILSILVHEMTHLEQCEYGDPSRNGYHNREWGMMMQRVGLMPSNTGKPGGKKTGRQMTHYIIQDGPFDKQCRSLLERGWKLDWHAPTGQVVKVENPPEPVAKVKINDSKTKFSCPECDQNAWAKPSAHLVCGHCGVRMHSSVQSKKSLGPAASLQ